MKLEKITDYETDTHRIIVLVDSNNPNGYAEGHLIPKEDRQKKSETNTTT